MILARRRYQLLVDVDVRIDLIRRAESAECWHALMTRGPQAFRALAVSKADYFARQQRVLRALLGNEAALNLWLHKEASLVVVEGNLEEFKPDTVADDILAPLIPAMAPADRWYFEGVLAKDLLCESVDPFCEATSAKPVSLIVAEIPRPGRRVDDALLQRNFRVVIEVDTEICEIDAHLAEERLQTYRDRYQINLASTPAAYIANQYKMAHAVVNNEPVLDAWLKSAALLEVAVLGARDLGISASDYDILRPVLAQLPSEDRLYFERAESGGVFFESLETLQAAMSVAIVSVSARRAPRTRGRAQV